jgi:uncharacterized protein
MHSASNFQIDTKTRNFISAQLPWRQDMVNMDKAFPQTVSSLLKNLARGKG